MTNKLRCPWCNSELHINSIGMLECRNDGCRQTVNMCGTTEMWKFVIDGKKAQEDLEYAKEKLECEKHNYSVLSEQKEIAYQNYLKITGDLQKQLQKAQDALKVATDFIGFVNTSRHADGALAAMAIGKLNEITSITK